jgi:hypothetical protein
MRGSGAQDPQLLRSPKSTNKKNERTGLITLFVLEIEREQGHNCDEMLMKTAAESIS